MVSKPEDNVEMMKAAQVEYSAYIAKSLNFHFDFFLLFPKISWNISLNSLISCQL
jgi:hypothetical protein